jgi:hypothetical protein
MQGGGRCLLQLRGASHDSRNRLHDQRAQVPASKEDCLLAGKICITARDRSYLPLHLGMLFGSHGSHKLVEPVLV